MPPLPYGTTAQLNALGIPTQDTTMSPYQNEPVDSRTGVQAPLAPGGQTTAGFVDPNALTQAQIDQYNQAIGNTQAAYDRTGAQLNSGYGSIDASYQNALNQLLGTKNTGQRNYGAATQTNATNYVGAKNTIGAQAGQTLNGLLRLLGSRGAGGSSAYNIAAPQAVARNASIQRNDAGTTFGQNQQGLDTNWNDYLNTYNNQVLGVGSQRDQSRQTLENQIATNKASLLQTLGQLTSARDQNVASAQPYLNQANSLLDKTANYTTAPITQNLAAYQAPTAASYTTAPQQNISGASTTGNDYASPYLQSLLGKKQLNPVG